MAKLTILNKYGIAPNILLNNPNISWKAKGLFTYLQSKPGDWDFSTERIKNDSTDGIDSTTTGLKELEDHGFLVRKKYQNEKGYWDIDYILTDNPTLDNPTLDNPTLDNPRQENPRINKERNTKKEIQRKNNKIYSENEISENEIVVDTIVKDFFSKQKNKILGVAQKLKNDDYLHKQQLEFDKLKRAMKKQGYDTNLIPLILDYITNDDFRFDKVQSIGKLLKKDRNDNPYWLVFIQKLKIEYDRKQSKTIGF